MFISQSKHHPSAILREFFAGLFSFPGVLEKTLISTNVKRYHRRMAGQQNYIPGTLESSTTFVFVQEARAELANIRVPAESYCTALAG